MAIKISNQVTFIEQKRILEIQEWYLATNYDSEVTVDDGEWGTWTKEVQTIDASKPYLWNYEKVIYSIGNPPHDISDPIIIGIYSKSDGRGIDAIINEYFLTEEPELPESPDWSRDSSTASGLTPTLKYLWNREIIVFTDGTNSEPTDPAIIGVYGDSGSSAVDFQIYSVDGFEFYEGLDSIELLTVAFQGGKSVEDESTYQWKYYNSASTNDDKYDEIPGATEQKLIVNRTDYYAFSSIKCELTYDGIVYSDYVSLTEKPSVYTSIIKFFDGSNIFDSSRPYIVAYVETYKDNQCEESINTNRYYDGESFVLNSGVIETDIEPEEGEQFNNNDLMYFIYEPSDGIYDIALGEYVDGSWTVNNNFTNKYVYANNINTSSTSNIVVISKESVSRSKELNVQVYQKAEEVTKDIDTSGLTHLTSCSATVVDINDPIISDKPPTNIKDGQLWLDTSETPHVLKIYTEKISYGYELSQEEDIAFTSTAGGSKTVCIADSISVSDDMTIVFEKSDEIVIQYNATNDITPLLDKFFYVDSFPSYILYAPSESVSVTVTLNEDGKKYTFTFNNIRRVNVKEIRSGEWVYFSQQNGGTVYTSKPESYKAGDLWILAKDETCGEYREGTMLKALVSSDTFDESHWTDSMEDVSATIKNIKETFSWSDDGLKISRMALDDNNNEIYPFYVHLDSTRMGFHSVVYDDNGVQQTDTEVVHIGINSAVIKNASFIDDTTDPDYSKYENNDDGVLFDCTATFNYPATMKGTTSENKVVGFTFQVEENGSFSLVLAP